MTVELKSSRVAAQAPKSYRDRKRSARRREVLDAASEAFAELGYHQTTIEEIARRVRMRSTGLYYYFESKEAALAAVCRQGAEWFLAGFEAIVGKNGAVEALIREGIAHHVQREDHAYIENFAHNRRNLSPPAQRRLAHFARRYRALWAELLARGVRTGELRAELDCDIAGIVIVGACNEATSAIRSMTSQEIATMRARIAAIVLDGARIERGRAN